MNAIKEEIKEAIYTRKNWENELNRNQFAYENKNVELDNSFF